MTHPGDFFGEHPEALRAFQSIANRHGQDIEASPVIDSGPLVGAVMVRHAHKRRPIAVIWPNGGAVDLTTLDAGGA